MARRRPIIFRGVITSLLCVVSPGVNAVEGDDALPPPPDVQAIERQAVFHLSLVVNYYDTGLVVPVTRRAGAMWVSSADLQRAGLPGDKLPPGDVNVDSLPQVKSRYDSVGQRLLLTVPTDWVASRTVALGEQERRVRPRASNGAVLNYDFYASDTNHGLRQASLWHEMRLFGDGGSLSSTGALREVFRGYPGQDEGYMRYDTTFNSTNDDNAWSWSLGDVISDSLSWSNSVRLGGINVGRDFSLRPDLITYPLPAFSGEAAVPSTVDVFINGYRSGSTELTPGPFTLTNLPYINGSGDAVLVTTDALGRQVSTTLPFYVASELLKPGLSDGAFSAGALRRNYGVKNFDYGPAAASGSWRYGVTDFWTLETHGEAAEKLTLAGVGSLFKIGRFGVINGAGSWSSMREQSGQQWNWGYQYNTAGFSLSTQQTRRTRGFGNLALYDQPVRYDQYQQPIVTLSRETTQYSLTLNMGAAGSVGAAWLDVQTFNRDHTRLLNLSWNKTLWNSSLYLAASHDYEDRDWTFALSLQIPLGEQSSVALSAETTPESGSTQRVNYSRAMPSDGGFSWNLAYANESRDDNYQQATLGWRNNHVEMQGGIYGQTKNLTRWGEATGSLVTLDGELFAANQINDAFAVVSTQGQPGVTVNFENQPIGETDEEGYLLVSGVTSYYPATYSIDALNLPADTRIRDTERRLALRRNSGYLVTFAMEQERVASVILHDENGLPLPVASQVLRPDRATAVVGYDGIAWLENIGEVNPLRVVKPDGKTCSVTLTVGPAREHRLETYGPLICREVAP